MSSLLADHLIIEFDRALRTVFAPARSVRPTPGAFCVESDLNEAERQLGIDDDGKAEVGWHLWLSVACDDRRLAARPGQFLPFFIESRRKMVDPTVLKPD